MGIVLNTVIGAGIKLAANLINFWLEHKRQQQLLLAARDSSLIQAILDNQAQQAKDPFVKVTRRVLFMTLTFTLCFLMVFYAMNPGIEYDIMVPKGEAPNTGLLNWFLGSSDEVVIVRLTGGLMLSSFMDLCFMVVGFYAVPSKVR